MELIEAAGRSDVETVRRLLAQGASVHARDAQGRTALVAAAYGNHLEVARALIEAGADVNAKDDTQQGCVARMGKGRIENVLIQAWSLDG